MATIKRTSAIFHFAHKLYDEMKPVINGCDADLPLAKMFEAVHDFLMAADEGWKTIRNGAEEDVTECSNDLQEAIRKTFEKQWEAIKKQYRAGGFVWNEFDD